MVNHNELCLYQFLLHTTDGWVMVQGVRDMFDITDIKGGDLSLQHLVFIGAHLDRQRLVNLTNMSVL